MSRTLAHVSPSVVTVLTLGLALAGLAGCFEAPRPNCQFLCGTGAPQCPDEYMCGTDDRCHLIVNGQPAVCEDPLPTIDAAGIDAIDVDADTTDADTTDASADADTTDADTTDAIQIDAFVNQAPVFTSEANLNVVAGTAVSIQVDATDPNANQTLTFTAPAAGTNRSPYVVRSGSPGGVDTAGGAFDPGTRTFTMPAGLLGTFDIDFTVTDGTDSDVEKVSVTVTASPVRINEVQIGTGAATRNLEIVNTGGGPVNLEGWKIVVGAAEFALPSISISAGAFLVLHADAGTDDASNLFSVLALNSLTTTGEVVLYETPSNLELSRFIRDFVAWDAGAPRLAQAVFAGQWPTSAAGDVADIGALAPDTGTLSRDLGTNTESKTDWYVEDTPTLGSVNVP